jgi:pectin methylesterase-like acyl-CoA thioesterase
MKYRGMCSTALIIIILAGSISHAQMEYEMIVAKDGSGTHSTVQTAFNAALADRNTIVVSAAKDTIQYGWRIPVSRQHSLHCRLWD